jgi:hypothetical protein
MAGPYASGPRIEEDRRVKRTIGITFVLLALLAGCTDEPAPQESDSSAVLTDFGSYTFVSSEPEAASNLEDFIRQAVPPGVEVLDVTVRSVRGGDQSVPTQVVAASYDPGDLAIEDLQVAIFKQVAPGATRQVLGGRGVLIASEGTAALAAFATETTLIYLIGPKAATLQEIGSGLLDR